MKKLDRLDWIILTGMAMLALCLVGMVLGAVAFAFEWPRLFDAAEWLTVPWTIIAGLPVVLIVACVALYPVLWLLWPLTRRIGEWRESRRPRRSRYFSR